MAQDRNLPEGTDKIIPGARETVEEVVIVEAVVATPGSPGSSGTGATGGPGSINQRGTGTSRQSGGAGGSQSGGSQPTGGGRSGGNRSDGGQSNGEGGSGKIMDKVRSGGEKLSGQAADKARGYVGQGLERGGDALSNVGRLVNDTASGIDERLGQEYGDYARRAAHAIDDTAQKLRSKNPDELIDDTRDFVRKSPGVALAGAAIVGFALARLVKSGLDAGTGRRDEGGSSGEAGRGDSFGQSGAGADRPGESGRGSGGGQSGAGADRPGESGRGGGGGGA